MKKRIVGLASAALWLVIAPAGFAIFSLILIDTPNAKWTLVPVTAFSLALTVVAIVLIRRAAQLPSASSPRSIEQRAIGRTFLLVFIAEVIAFGVVNPLFAITNHADMLAALNVAIIGLHFLPLAWVFHVPRYYVLGSLFCAIAAVTLLLVPATSELGQARLWYVLPSLGALPVAWTVAGANLWEVRRELARIHALPQPV